MNKLLVRGLATTSALILATGLSLGISTSAQAADTCTWGITSLTLDDDVVTDVNPTSGDDGGYLVALQNYLFLANDSSAYTYNLSTLADNAPTDAGYDDGAISQVGDLKSNIGYELHIGANTSDQLDEMTELDQDGNLTTNVISFSEAIDLSSSQYALLNGYGFIAIWDYQGGILYTIQPDGTVTTVDSSTNVNADYTVGLGNHSEGSSYFSMAGVAEFDGTDYYFVGTDSNTNISRFNITGAATQETLVTNADSWSDSDTMTVSTTANKWYIHTENNLGHSTFFGVNVTGNDEPVLAFNATFTPASCDSPSPTPNLPDTGVDGTQAGLMAAGAGLLALAGVAFVVIRRRANA